MAGHSKWANIKHRKGKADAARGAAYTKIGREIAIAVREGGSDPAVNGKLRDAIAKAKANNVPNDNIMRSIRKASGEEGNLVYEEITYEGYAPGGVAVIVEVVTDNRNRTAADLRHIFDKHGGSLGTTGSVSYLFEHKGVMVIDRESGPDEETLMMMALEAGAEDMQTLDDAFEIHTAANGFSAVRELLEGKGLSFLSAERQKIPSATVQVGDEEALEKVQKLLMMLEESDDVMEVFHNADLPLEEAEE